MRCEAPKKTVSYQTMSQPSAKSPELSFEKALAELEKIVAKMESGELSLEQALATHQRGLELARFCQQRLEAAPEAGKGLEGGGRSRGRALATPQRGVGIARCCQQRLEAAQQQVKVLEGEVLKPLANLGE